jgi:glucose/arabinose dehydrogenase
LSRFPTPAALSALAAVSLLDACNGGQANSSDGGVTDATPPDVVMDVPPPPPHDGPNTLFSELPGSLCFGPDGKRTLVPGGLAAPTLTWLTLPDGFCVHYFAHVTKTRQIRFAPGGELFAASPSTPTSGLAPIGLGQILVLSDDDADGYADGDSLPHSDGSPQNLTSFTSVASVQGLLFTPGFLYFQNGTQIMKVPYTTGQKALKGTPEVVADVSMANGMYVSAIHWPKTLDISDDGTIYVGNGGDQSQQCNSSVFPTLPFTGGVLKIDGTPAGTPVARGFRNPYAVRCQKGHDLCFSAELGLDGSGSEGGREKIVPTRPGDDWGYPCCATTNVPEPEVTGTPNCSSVPTEPVSFVIGNTPFGLDFETGVWPAPFTNNIVVTLHGQTGTWVGARIVAIPTQSNGMPVPSSDLGASTLVDFATGWDDGVRDHGRPGAVTFAADGRAFIANDYNGDIFWIAPVGLKIP